MRIAVAGGDLRMLTVAKLFDASGQECVKYALGEDKTSSKEALSKSEAVILPLPCTKGGYLNAPMSNDKINIGDIFALCGKDTVFLGGKMPFTDERHIDYSEYEEFQLKNAVPTVEGAIAIAMNELDITLNGANAVVIGYGRIGNYLSEILSGMHCNVSVVARRAPSRALAEMSGYKAVDFGKIEVYKNADIIFNTVPFTVLRENELSSMQKGTTVIDLASLPGGVEEDAAARNGIKLIRALALPGKYSPETAGRIIFDTAVSILRERGSGV